MNKQTEETYEMAKRMILHKVRKGNLGLEKIEQINQVMDEIPVMQDKESDEYLKAGGARAECTVSRDAGYVMLLPSDITPNVEDIDAIIHELAHVFSKNISVNKIGTLIMNIIIEEAMAVGFSEACVNEWIKDYGGILGEKVENGYRDNISVYPEERNILNAVFFAMSDDNSDDRAMEEYLFGDKSKFTEIGAKKLGKEFYSIVKTMENEINKRNFGANGIGFRERNAIRGVCAKVERMLMPMIPIANVRQTDKSSQDMKIKQVRYLSLSPMIRKAEREQTLNENREKYLKEWELETGYSYEELDETLSLELMDMICKSNHKKNFIMSVIARQQEIGYTARQLLNIGFYDSEIPNILYCNEEQRESTIKLRSAGIDYTMKELLDSGFSVHEINELMGENISNQEVKKRIEHECDRKRFTSILRNQYLSAIDKKKSIGEVQRIIRNYAKEKLLSKGFSDSEIEEIVIYETKQVAKQVAQREEWEKEVGYTTEELLKQGFTDSEIVELQYKFDGETGEKLDRKSRMEQAMKDKIEKQVAEQVARREEWEKEVGYKMEELLKQGFTDREIAELQYKFDGETGEKLDRKSRMEQAIKNKEESNKVQVTMKSLIQETLGADQIRSGELDKIDRIEQKESIKEELKEGVSIVD